MSSKVISQLGESHPLQNSKEWEAASCPVRRQYPWTACFQINLHWSCFHKKDDLPVAITINCFHFCAVGVQNLIKSLSQALQMPPLPPHKPLQCLHFLSCCEETALGPVLVCWGRGRGAHALWLVSKDRCAKGCHSSCLCCPLTVSFCYTHTLKDICQIQTPCTPVICVSFLTFHMIRTSVFIC